MDFRGQAAGDEDFSDTGFTGYAGFFFTTSRFLRSLALCFDTGKLCESGFFLALQIHCTPCSTLAFGAQGDELCCILDRILGNLFGLRTDMIEYGTIAATDTVCNLLIGQTFFSQKLHLADIISGNGMTFKLQPKLTGSYMDSMSSHAEIASAFQCRLSGFVCFEQLFVGELAGGELDSARSQNRANGFFAQVECAGKFFDISTRLVQLDDQFITTRDEIALHIVFLLRIKVIVNCESYRPETPAPT